MYPKTAVRTIIVIAVAYIAVPLIILLAGCSGSSSAPVDDVPNSNQETSSLGEPTVSTSKDTMAALSAETASIETGARSPGQSDPQFTTVADIIDKITPSVVHIQTDKIKLDEFSRPVPFVGAGTGVVINTRGYIVTNEHVIRDAKKILVKVENRNTFEAELVGSDFPTDLAVLHVEASELTPVTLGKSSDLRVGEQVIAVGHALDLAGGPTVTGGLVSAFRRHIVNHDETRTLRHLIQTDAAINEGNSGGPLVNLRGQMVGINTSTIPTADGISFSVAIDQVRPLIDQILEDGSVDQGFLGVTSVNVSETLAMNLGLSVNSGVSIIVVAPGSPADRAGLLVGDVIVRVDENEVSRGSDLDRILARRKTGESIVIQFIRNGQQMEVTVVLGSRPKS